MKLTVSRVLCWLTAAYFTLTGLIQALVGLLALSVTNMLSAGLSILLAIIVLPKSRQVLRDRYNLEFSRGLVVGIMIVGFLITSALGSLPTANTNTPSEVIREYGEEQFSSDTDYERLYNMFYHGDSNETKEEWIEDQENHMEKRKEMVSYEFQEIENVTTRNETATVIFEVDRSGMVSGTTEQKAELRLVNGTWKIDSISEAN